MERQLKERIGNVWIEEDRGRGKRTVEEENKSYFRLRKFSVGKFLKEKKKNFLTLLIHFFICSFRIKHLINNNSWLI